MLSHRPEGREQLVELQVLSTLKGLGQRPLQRLAHHGVDLLLRLKGKIRLKPGGWQITEVRASHQATPGSNHGAANFFSA